MGNVIDFRRRDERDPDEVLESAKGSLKRVIVIGVGENEEAYLDVSDPSFHSVVGDIETAKWLLMHATHEIYES